MSNHKFIKDYRLLSEKKKQNVINISQAKMNTVDGYANRNLVEPVPNFIQADSEKVISNSNNAWIVLGRDRPAGRLSGYGGRGDTQAASIDLVAGRLGHLATEVNPDTLDDAWTDPNTRLDAARIVLSQKTDVDTNFGLVGGRVGNATTRSAIAVKADGVRIIAREGVKIVTGGHSQNSQGGDISSVYGIDLIAGNDDSDLQPMVKGSNLIEALERITEHIKNLTSLTENFLSAQMKFNNAVMIHTHVGNLSVPTTPSAELITAGIASNVQMFANDIFKLPLHRTNLEMFKMNYLKPFGAKYINSRHNNTN